MTDTERIDALADILFTLIGDLGKSGSINEHTRDQLWDRVQRIQNYQPPNPDNTESTEDPR